MATSQERVQRGFKPGSVSFVSISASLSVDDGAVLDTVINDDFARCRAENPEAKSEQAVTISRGGVEYAYITLRGHHDHHAAQRLRTRLGAILDTGARYLTVDLSGLNYCDEVMLDVLDWAARRASSQQGWLTLAGGRHHIRLTARGHRFGK